MSSEEEKIIQFPIDQDRLEYLADRFEDHFSQTGEFLHTGKTAYVERLCLEIFLLFINALLWLIHNNVKNGAYNILSFL